MMHLHLNPLQVGDTPIAVTPFPLDRVIIRTSVRIRNEVAECKPEDIGALRLKARPHGQNASSAGQKGVVPPWAER